MDYLTTSNAGVLNSPRSAVIAYIPVAIGVNSNVVAVLLISLTWSAEYFYTRA